MEPFLHKLKNHNISLKLMLSLVNNSIKNFWDWILTCLGAHGSQAVLASRCNLHITET